MKEKILAVLLIALLIVNISSCDFDSQSEIYDSLENIDNTKSRFEENDKKITERETNAEINSTQKLPNFQNGVRGNPNVTYTFNSNSEFSVHVADWDEDHLITSLLDKDINAVKYSNTAVAVNNERAFLILKQFYEPKITVVSFEKDSPSETVLNLNIDEDVYEFSVYFINENIGYLFAFKEVSEDHATGGSKLSNLFKTEDGGKTWDSINVQNVPSISLRNDINFAKMISKDVGLISGGLGPADYDFCERTLLTTDGGLNWVIVSIPELPQDDDLHWAVVSDFTLVDASYILTIRYEISEADYAYAKYKLIDPNSWVRIS